MYSIQNTEIFAFSNTVSYGTFLQINFFLWMTHFFFLFNDMKVTATVCLTLESWSLPVLLFDPHVLHFPFFFFLMPDVILMDNILNKCKFLSQSCWDFHLLVFSPAQVPAINLVVNRLLVCRIYSTASFPKLEIYQQAIGKDIYLGLNKHFFLLKLSLKIQSLHHKNPDGASLSKLFTSDYQPQCFNTK